MDLSKTIEVCGLSQYRDVILGLSRPSVRIVVESSETPHTSGGPYSSRFGGLPLLGPEQPWPRWREKPLSHLATINLAEVARFDAEGMLPRAGLLRFWYDQYESPWGFDPSEAGFFKVEHITEVEGLRAAHAPDNLEPFPACSLRFERELTPPDYAWIRKFASEHRALASSDLYEALSGMLDLQNSHRLLGHPALVQGTMELECQLVTNGLNSGDGTGHEDPRRVDLEPGALDWILLLQLDSDDTAGWTWDDCGKLYFWIKRDDLRALRFDRAWMILQSY